MTHQFGKHADMDADAAQELLEELEVHHPVDVSRARDLSSRRVKSAVVARPANVCDRHLTVVEGVAVLLGRQGVTCRFGTTVVVGSVFHLTFDRVEVDLAPRLAVCDRCAMLSDSTFDVHFQFVQEAELPPSSDGHE